MNPSPLRTTNRFQPWLQHILTTQSWILVLFNTKSVPVHLLVHTRSFAVEVFFIKFFFFLNNTKLVSTLYANKIQHLSSLPHSVVYGLFPNDTFHADSFYGKGGFCLMLTVLPVHWWSTFFFFAWKVANNSGVG